jgi:hypothetical protein
MDSTHNDWEYKRANATPSSGRCCILHFLMMNTKDELNITLLLDECSRLEDDEIFRARESFS